MSTPPNKIPQRLRCSNAKRYKATRAPKCGCRDCENKWARRSVLPPAMTLPARVKTSYP